MLGHDDRSLGWSTPDEIDRLIDGLHDVRRILEL